VRSGARVVVRGLDADSTYRVSARRRTPNGVSEWSEKSVAVRPTGLTAGGKVRTSSLAFSTEAKVRGRWTVDEVNKWNCRVAGGRIQFLRSGACDVSVVPAYTNVAVTRSFTPGEGRAPAASGSGRRLVYDRSARRLYAIEADNRVLRSTTVVSPPSVPVTGRYKVSRTADGFTASSGGSAIDFRGIVSEFGPEALGTSASANGMWLAPPDIAPFRKIVTRTKLLFIIP